MQIVFIVRCVMYDCFDCSLSFFFFFFKQKTAYEIYQCDWSSDVCSSDLLVRRHLESGDPSMARLIGSIGDVEYINMDDNLFRSEERRVGKECRSRWSPYH